VSEAASVLGVHSSRVRQLLHSGAIEGRLVGGRWLVDGESVRARKEHGASASRPLSPRNAWGLLALLDGSPPHWLSAQEKARAKARLRELAASGRHSAVVLRSLLAARAQVRRYRAHSGLLAAVLNDSAIVLSGASAAVAAGASYVAPGVGEGYVCDVDTMLRLESDYGLDRDSSNANLVIRIPAMERLPFLAGAISSSDRPLYAPAAVVAADLLDIREDRADVAALELFESLFAGFSQQGKRSPW
jgi:excisionase family DNA binding protein